MAFRRSTCALALGRSRISPTYNFNLVGGGVNNTWIFPFFSGAAFLGLSMYALAKNLGFLSDWGRVKHLTAGGEYRQLLEPGTSPDNMHLPPHLRLDMVSYLDGPECRIAEAPMYDLSVSESDMLMSLYDTMRDDQKVAYDFVLGGCLAMTQMAVPHFNVERVVSRRMTLAEHNMKTKEGDRGRGDAFVGLSEEEWHEAQQSLQQQRAQRGEMDLPIGVSVVEKVRDRKVDDGSKKWY